MPQNFRAVQAAGPADRFLATATATLTHTTPNSMFLRHAVPVMEISNKLIASGCIFYSSTEFQGPSVCDQPNPAQPCPDRPIISECIVDVCSVAALRKQCKFYKI